MAPQARGGKGASRAQRGREGEGLGRVSIINLLIWACCHCLSPCPMQHNTQAGPAPFGVAYEETTWWNYYSPPWESASSAARRGRTAGPSTTNRMLPSATSAPRTGPRRGRTTQSRATLNRTHSCTWRSCSRRKNFHLIDGTNRKNTHYCFFNYPVRSIL